MTTSLGACLGKLASTISYIKWSVVQPSQSKEKHWLPCHWFSWHCSYYYLLLLYHAPTLSGSDFIVLLQLLNFQYIYKCTKPGIPVLCQGASILRGCGGMKHWQLRNDQAAADSPMWGGKASILWIGQRCPFHFPPDWRWCRSVHISGAIWTEKHG